MDTASPPPEQSADNDFDFLSKIDLTDDDLPSTASQHRQKLEQQQDKRSHYSKLFPYSYLKSTRHKAEVTGYMAQKRAKKRNQDKRRKQQKNQQRTLNAGPGTPKPQPKQYYLDFLRRNKQRRNQTKHRLRANQKTGMRVVIDCGFETSMNRQELSSLFIQINLCYSRMKQSAQKYDLTLLNYSGRCRTRP